jgi:hypothetical protein
MPVGISSPARNLFLLGSTGEQTVTNFFKAVDLSASTDGVFLSESLKYRYDDDSYTIAGSASDPQSKGFGWIENRTYNPDTAASTQVWDYRIESTTGQNVLLRSMIFDQVGNIIAVGHGGGTSWIQRYSSAGVLDWQATTFTGNVRYRDVAHDGTSYYVCGHTGPGDDDAATAYVEKYDSQGNPIWGKGTLFEGDDVILKSIAVADDGNILAVGRIDDNDGQKGFMVKLNSQTGDILWDKTIASPKSFNQFLTISESVGLEKIYADGNGQFYVVGRIQSLRSGALAFRGTLIKFDTEGNIIWQRETPLTSTKSIEFYDVSAETETEQVIVLGRYYDGTANDEMGMLSKYTKNGTLLWRRTIKSSRESSDTFSTTTNPPSLDADASFYYVLFHDETTNTLSGEPDRYTFGKVSTSGNGLGDFQYDDSTGETIDYEIVNINSEVGVLQDGSVTNSVSDLRSTPYSATKIVFDDYATNIAGKKRQISDKNLFSYDGSPAIRPADFRELNLLGDTGFVEGPNLITNGTFDNDINGWTGTGISLLHNSFTTSWDSNGYLEVNSNTNIGSYYGISQDVPTINGKVYKISIEVVSGSGTSGAMRVQNGNLGTNPLPTQTSLGVGTHEFYFTAGDQGFSKVFLGRSANLNGANNVVVLYDNIKVCEVSVVDQSGKGNNGVVNGPTHNAAGYWEFDGVDDTIDLGTTSLIEPSSSFSIEGWCWVDSLTTECSIYEISANGNSGTILLSAGSNTDANVGGRFLVRNSSGQDQGVRDVINNNLGEWHHYVGVHINNGNSSSTTLYVDGVGTLSQSKIDAPHTFDFTNVGVQHLGLSAGSRYLDGRIGEVRIYPIALTAAQVFQNYNATKSKYINEAPYTAPKISTDSIVYGSNLLLNYDFGNRATYDRVENLFQYNNDPTTVASGTATKTLVQIKQPTGEIGPAMETDASGFAQNYRNITASSNTAPGYLTFYAKKKSAGSTGTLTITMEGGGTARSFHTRTINSETWTKISTTHNWSSANATLRRFDIYFNGSGNTSDGDTSFYLTNHQFEEATSPGRFVRTYGTAITAPTTVKNLSSFSYTGTLNGPTFNTDGSFQFDGTDDDINTGLSWTPANTFSFTMWFNLDTIKEWHNLVDMYQNDTRRNFQLFVEGDGDFRIFWGTASDTSAITGTVANTWYFGAFTSDGENGTLYRYGNGTTDSVSATAGGGNYFVKPLVLGRRGDSSANGFVDGKIGEFQFYQGELTSSQVLQNYNATRGKYGV